MDKEFLTYQVGNILWWKMIDEHVLWKAIKYQCLRYWSHNNNRLAARVLVVAPMTLMMTQQRTRTICNSKLIAIVSCLEKIYRANQIARMRNSIISLDKGNSDLKIEVIIVRQNFHVNISEQFRIRE